MIRRFSLIAAGSLLPFFALAQTNAFSLPTPVAALNTLPGVRADERSPGSYRLAIWGS
jgi:hypothetical protein